MTAIFKSPSINFIQDYLLKDMALSKIIEECFGKLPEANILDEKIEEGQYLRKETWEILSDDLYFQPVGFSYLSLNIQDNPEINPGRILLIEEIKQIHKNLKFEVTQPINDHTFEEVKNYLREPFYGRCVKIKKNNEEIGELIEFIALQPNTNINISLFDYLNFHVHTKALPDQRIEDLLLHIEGALNTDRHTLLKNLLPNLSRESLKAIEKEIIGIDHVAFMVLPYSKIETIDEEATLTHFPERHTQFDSTIMAKELGSTIGRERVPTKIFKASGYNSHKERIGVEIFIPNEKAETINKWIDEGKGAHIAFRVKSLSSIDRLFKILKDNQIKVPDFMNGQPMQNVQENSTTLYFNVPLHNHDFRMELFYKP